MQEHYPTAKDAHPGFPSKDIIAMIAKQWAELGLNEKAEWKSRAALTHSEGGGVDGEVAAAATEVDDDDDAENDEDDDEEDDEEEVEASDVDDDDGETAPPARKSRGKKADNSYYGRVPGTGQGKVSLV